MTPRCGTCVARQPRDGVLVLPRPLVLAALLVVMAGARVAKPSRSDAAGALAADVTTWTITGRGAVNVRLTGQLVRTGSPLLRLNHRVLATNRGNALVASRLFSAFPNVLRPSGGGKVLAQELGAACRYAF